MLKAACLTTRLGHLGSRAAAGRRRNQTSLRGVGVAVGATRIGVRRDLLQQEERGRRKAKAFHVAYVRDQGERLV